MNFIKALKEVLFNLRHIYIATIFTSLRSEGLVNTWHKAIDAFKQIYVKNISYKKWLSIHEPKHFLDQDKIDGSVLISIVVPVFNTKKFHLEEMLKSVVGQTFASRV